MKKERQKTENEKLLEFGVRLSNLVSEIEELKKKPQN